MDIEIFDVINNIIYDISGGTHSSIRFSKPYTVVPVRKIKHVKVY